MTDAETIRPEAYPELEAEVYLALDLDRDTLTPPPATLRELVAATEPE
jgi:hypothetical protein